MSLSLFELHQLMHELGPATPEITAIIQHEAGSWEIWFERDVCLSLEWQLAEPRLSLSMALGDFAESSGSDRYADLLKANLTWSAQGAARAVMCESGLLMLIAEPVLASASLPGLQQHLRRFVLQAAQFASLLLPAAGHELPAPAPDCLTSIERA